MEILKWNSTLPLGSWFEIFVFPKKKEETRAKSKRKLIFKRHAHHNITVVLIFTAPHVFFLPSHPAHPRAKKKKYLTKQQERPTVKSSPSVAASSCCFFFRQGNKSENINTRWPREIFEKFNFNKSFQFLVTDIS